MESTGLSHTWWSKGRLVSLNRLSRFLFCSLHICLISILLQSICCYICFSVLYIYIFERNKCWFVDISITICDLFFLLNSFLQLTCIILKMISFINCCTVLFQKCYIYTQPRDCKLQKQYLTKTHWWEQENHY